MSKWLRRIRGAIGMGVTWAVGWILVGALLALGLWVAGLDPPGFFWVITEVFGILGFLGGSIFSALLRLTEGGRKFDELSLPRFAAWGGFGGLLLGGLADVWLLGGPSLHPVHAVFAGTIVLLGAGSAIGTLALARKARDDPRLTAGGELERLD